MHTSRFPHPGVILILTILLPFLAYSAPNLSDYCTPGGNFEVLHSFSFLNFTFESVSESNDYISNGYYKNCMLAGIKVSEDDEIFVSVPRWKDDVPATLNKVVIRDGKTLLQPYPSWEWNKVGKHGAIQSVLGFEIDTKGRMWILDQGKVAGNAGKPDSMKLVIWDMRSNSLIGIHYFPNNVVDLSNSFLNDIVVDTELDIAYITDSGLPITPDLNTPLFGGLIVFNLAKNESTRHLSQQISTQDDPSLWINIDGERVGDSLPMRTGADGIALDCNRQTLYYTPLSSRTLYSVPTAALIANVPDTDIKVTTMGYKLSSSDGIMATSDGRVWMTALEMNAILTTPPRPQWIYPIAADVDTEANSGATWPSSPYGTMDYRLLIVAAQSNDSLVWPDTLGMDKYGRIYAVSNHLHHFVSGKMIFPTFTLVNGSYISDGAGKGNFHIVRADSCAKSYLYGCTQPAVTPSPTPAHSIKPTPAPVPPAPQGPVIAILVTMIVIVAAALIAVLVFEARHGHLFAALRLSKVDRTSINGMRTPPGVYGIDYRAQVDDDSD